MHQLILVLFAILILKIPEIDTYTNYEDIKIEEDKNNCPLLSAEQYLWTISQKKMLQLPGYTKDEILDMTRYSVFDQPIPVSPDFLKI